MSPRSILKRTTERNTTGAPQHAVHFPPSPSLCSTFSAYSPSAYDRSPIVVSKNVCALPERGGRTYVLDETTCPRSTAGAPRAQPSRSYHPRDDRRAGVPALIPDVSSSESDESDAFNNSPYAIPHPNYYSYGSHGLPTKYDHDPAAYSPCVDSASDINALAFLPYPPSPPALDDKTRRRRKNDGALDLERMRIANSSSSSTSSFESERAAPPPPSKKRSSSKRREYLNGLASSSPFGSFGLTDDGCLGGF